MNKVISEKKFYAFNTVFRVDVNDVKPFQNTTGRLPSDHFHDRQSMPRLFKTKKKTVFDSNVAFLTMFQQFTTGPGWLRVYQHDNVIDNHVEHAIIIRIHELL